jgi:uncharacterized delta-60 repeat protein
LVSEYQLTEHKEMVNNLILSAVIILLTFVSYAQPGSNDPSFNPDDQGFSLGDGANSYVLSSAIQDDGKILIGGYFSQYNGTIRNRIARLQIDGSLDTSFNPGTGFNGSIRTMVLQSNGKTLAAGSFTIFNGTSRKRIARINTDGSLDTTFNPGTGASSNVLTMALQGDGKIIIGGYFTDYNGITANHLARINTDGSFDTTFNSGSGANSEVFSIDIQSDGKILIAGLFTSYNGTVRNRIARLNTDGSLDTTFNPGTGASGNILVMAIQSDGRILIGGYFTSFGGSSVNRIARLDTYGSLDTTFNPGSGFSGVVYSSQILTDGNIIIGGDFVSCNGVVVNNIARLDTDGNLDSTFYSGIGADSIIYTTSIQSDGGILIGGNFTKYNGTSINRITRLNPNGNLDIAFNPGSGFFGTVYTASIQSDHKILVAGHFTKYNGVERNHISRLNIDGSLDATFNPGSGADYDIYAMAIQNDGKIVIGGYFNSYNGTAINRIARLKSDGSLDTTFNPGSGVNNTISQVALQSDGKILIAGGFSYYNGTSIKRIARLHSDGSLDMSFDPGSGANNQIYSMAIQSDGKILIGGYFTYYNGSAAKHLARLNADGSLDTTFTSGSGTNTGVSTLAIQSDGKVLIGGYFNSYNGTAVNDLARLFANGNLDTTFSSGTGNNTSIFTITIQTDDRILIGGYFDSYDGIARNSIARLNMDGSLDEVFDPGTGTNSYVQTFAIQEDGKLIIGGGFTSYNGTGRNRIARVLTYYSETTEICEGDTYNWHGSNFTTSGIYYDSLINMAGLDSIHQLTLEVNPKYSFTENYLICSNETYNWHGNNYTSSGVYFDSLTTPAGCDSTYQLTLNVNSAYSIMEEHNMCGGETYNWRGTNYSTSGIYYDSLIAVNGCDSVFQLTLNVTEYLISEIVTICNGVSYTWHGTIYSTAGVYYDSLSTVNGCDSIYQLILNSEEYFVEESVNICDGETFHWHGLDYNTAGLYYDSLITFVGCDSIHLLTLTVHPDYSYSESYSICSGESYNWHGMNYTSSGVYYDSLSTIAGCDSIFELILIVKPSYWFEENHSMCDGDTYSWRGSIYTTAGLYYDSLYTLNGCDSIYQLILETPSYAFAESVKLCDGESYYWQGTNYNTSGVYYDSLFSIIGCDSIYQLTLNVNPVYSFTDSMAVCEGETYSWHGTNYSVTGVYYDNLNTIAGCDSAYQLNFTINSIDTSVSISGAMLTANQVVDSYQWLNCDSANAPIYGAVFQSHTATTNGSYAVEFTLGTCQDTSSCREIRTLGDNSTRIQGDISIYPNPFSDELIIEMNDNGEKVSIEIWNTLGQVVFKDKFTDKTIVPGNHLSSGVYVIKLTGMLPGLAGNRTTETRMLIKE